MASPLAHIVYFTLKENTPDNRQHMLDACQKYLTGHPGTVYFGAGVLAEELQRPVNDRAFHIALHVIFDSQASHDRYQVDPRHLAFIEENKPLWEQVRVFDSLLSSPS